MRKLINYEMEVKKVYPDAFKHSVESGSVILSAKKAELTNMIVVGRCPFLSEGDAWKSAYESLKQKGTI